MRKSILILLGGLMSIYSCQRSDIDSPNSSGKEGEIYVSLRSQNNTRALIDGTDEDDSNVESGTDRELAIDSLDLLIFNSDGEYLYRVHGVSQNNSIYSAVLKVTEESETLDVYFIANSRNMIKNLISTGQLEDDSRLSISEVRKLLVDSRMFGEESALPMWGYKEDLTVKKDRVSNWGNVNMLRSVIGVDIFENVDLVNFKLGTAKIFFAPDKGYIAPDHIGESGFTPNYSYGDNYVIKSESPEGMKTSVKTEEAISESKIISGTADTYNVITNKLYVYENDTETKTYNEVDRRYTRVVVGGEYNDGTEKKMYYYPIDFLKPNLDSEGNVTSYDYKTTMRNTKYVFVINSVSGPGYETEEEASESVPVNINVQIYDWNISNETEAGFDGTYYVSLETKKINLNRKSGSYRTITATTNAPLAMVKTAFQDESNGVAVEAFDMVAKLDLDGNPIMDNDGNIEYEQKLIPGAYQNDRFRYQIIDKDSDGFMDHIKITAVGNFDINNASANTDILVMQAGSIKFEIIINQLNSDASDWDNGGNIDFDNLGA